MSSIGFTPKDKFSYLKIAENHLNDHIRPRCRTIGYPQIISYEDWVEYMSDWYFPAEAFSWSDSSTEELTQKSIDFCLILAAVNGEL